MERSSAPRLRVDLLVISLPSGEVSTHVETRLARAQSLMEKPAIAKK